MTALIHVLYTFICFNKSSKSVLFVSNILKQIMYWFFLMNKIMPHSVSRKVKADENKTNKIIQLEGREAVEINSCILKQCFRY